MADSSEVVTAYRRATGSLWLVYEDGREERVARERFVTEFRRLYPGKRLPWEGDRPTHAITE